jgi:hypothetical protein
MMKPFQVYLDPRDRTLLERLAKTTGFSQAQSGPRGHQTVGGGTRWRG